MSLRALSLGAATGAAVVAGVPTWTATNLGTPPRHPFARVQGVLVNVHGTAVAVGTEGVDAGTRTQAFVWQKGKKTILTYRRATDIAPVAIDSGGDVVGTAGNRAVLWHKGAPRLLGHFQPTAMSSTGDLVVGGAAHALFWHRGTLTRLRDLGGSQSQANAVNRSGTVVGSSLLPSGREHAVVWRHGEPTDLGAPNGLNSTATLISASGTIFGFASRGASVVAVLEWKRGKMFDLGSFGGPAAQPIAMNARGDVLVSTETGDQVSLGLRLLRAGKTVSVGVPALGHQHLYGVGLSNQDDVVGHGLTRAFVWRNGHVKLLPQGLTPVKVAGTWIIASNGLTDRAILLRLHS